MIMIHRCRKAVFTIVLCIFLPACAPTSDQVPMEYIRADGKRAAGDQKLRTEFELSKASCIGNTEAANLAAGANYYGNFTMYVLEERRRRNAQESIMVGCMASKGYLWVRVDQSTAISASLSNPGAK